MKLTIKSDSEVIGYHTREREKVIGNERSIDIDTPLMLQLGSVTKSVEYNIRTLQDEGTIPRFDSEEDFQKAAQEVDQEGDGSYGDDFYHGYQDDSLTVTITNNGPVRVFCQSGGENKTTAILPGESVAMVIKGTLDVFEYATPPLLCE